MKQKIDPNIYCVMLGANKKDEKGGPLFSASRMEYVVENKTKALQKYAEYCKELDQFKAEDWSSGIVQMFNPIILPNGSFTTYTTADNICEYRFGIQEKQQKEDSDGIAIVKKPKTSVQRSNKKRNF